MIWPGRRASGGAIGGVVDDTADIPFIITSGTVAEGAEIKTSDVFCGRGRGGEVITD